MINYVTFPALGNASEDGLLAMGGNLSVDTLVSAYSQGIFPWFNDDQPILWWSPNPRMVLYPGELRISRSLRKVLKQQRFSITCDQAFNEVIQCCAQRGSDKVPVNKSTETWITNEMLVAYQKLFERGYAHSIEVWQGPADQASLVGGLYGVVLGKVFFGESMFSSTSNASKVALVCLCNWLKQLDFRVIDCQVASEHLFSLGARKIPREKFIEHLQGIDISQTSAEFAQGFKTAVSASNKTCYK
jgi:leucyl/phenylalanyl-tRNA--protein transferase